MRKVQTTREVPNRQEEMSNGGYERGDVYDN